MRIDVMEYKPNKNNIIKVVAIVIVVLIVIAFFSILGINCAKKYKQQYKENKKTEQIKNSNEENNINDTMENSHINEAKKKTDNIYNKDSKIAYLTFDDGPSQAVTPFILDVLKKENIKATFFVLGTNVKNNPEIVRRAYEEGHYIANHGYSHNYSKIYSSEKKVLEEYNKTEKQIRNAIKNNNYSSNLFRFPGGYEGGKYEKIKQKAAKLLNKNNIMYVDWNVLTGDSEGANTKKQILKNVKKHIKNKGNIVILMHDSSSKILTYETLTDVINYLRKEGYTFDNFYCIMQ